MPKQEQWMQRTLLTLTVGLIPSLLISVSPLPGLASLEVEMVAQQNFPAVEENLPSVDYNPPNQGAPGDTRDAGSRPSCPTLETPFTAISPSATNWGETLDAHPTFWLYIPETTGTLEFILINETNPSAAPYRTTFEVASQAGIQGFALPETAPALAVDDLYRWQFHLTCPEADQAYFQVNGVIVRRSPPASFTEQLTTASPRQRVVFLAAQGLWYNALTELAELRLANPDDEQLLEDWANLLQHPSVLLEDMISQPLLD